MEELKYMTKEYLGKIPQGLSEEELIEREFDDKKRELRIGQVRALVVKNQIIDAYTILENIRFDFVSDTAFREKVVGAKRSLERAIDDFLLDDAYWKKCIEKYNNMSLEDYKTMLLEQSKAPTQSSK